MRTTLPSLFSLDPSLDAPVGRVRGDMWGEVGTLTKQDIKRKEGPGFKREG